MCSYPLAAWPTDVSGAADYCRFDEPGGTTFTTASGPMTGSYNMYPSYFGQPGVLAGDSGPAVKFGGEGTDARVPDQAGLNPTTPQHNAHSPAGLIRVGQWAQLAASYTPGGSQSST